MHAQDAHVNLLPNSTPLLGWVGVFNGSGSGSGSGSGCLMHFSLICFLTSTFFFGINVLLWCSNITEYMALELNFYQLYWLFRKLCSSFSEKPDKNTE